MQTGEEEGAARQMAREKSAWQTERDAKSGEVHLLNILHYMPLILWPADDDLVEAVS